MPRATETETIFDCEPLMVPEESPLYGELREKAFEVGNASGKLFASVPAELHAPFADLMRVANCYYSNLIEGQDTHPISAERALREEYDSDPIKRDLQREAVSHITVQRWIDEGGLGDRHPMNPDSILEIHRRFCEGLPDDLLKVTNPQTGEERIVVPGEFRRGFVQVGRHKPVGPDVVPAFLDHMHKRYSVAGRLTGILSAAYSHHRLAWVHPFDDLNGRVTRMVSHAMLMRNADSGGMWSVSRGLSRREIEYKRYLQAADKPRQGDLDGRGNLSEGALADFAHFFLDVCLDQINFMSDLFEPAGLRDRILAWVREGIESKRLPGGSDLVMMQALFRGGKLERAEIPEIIGKGERAARGVTSALIGEGALRSESHRAPLHLSINSALALSWMPRLIPPAPAEQ